MPDEKDPKEPESTETAEVETPEVKALSQEDINKLIEGARKQEKDKLYGTIDELKEQIGNLTKSQKLDKEEKDRIAKEAKDKADTERQQGLSVEDRISEMQRTFEDKLAREKQEREKLEAALQEEREAAELERYKHQLLESAGDEIVKELVGGNSKAEIEASITTAKSKYQDYFQAAVKNAEGDPKRKIQDAGAKMPKPGDPDPDPVDEEGLRGLIPKIDPSQSGAGKVNEEYLKNRDQILARVASQYGKQ